MEAYSPLFWLGATILFCVIEAATVQLISIWFGVGSLLALVSSMFGAPVWLQLIVFFFSTAVVLVATRPLAKKLIGARKTATNADRVVGTTAIVEEPIDNLRETGRVFADGLSWAARTEDGNIVAQGQKVLVERIEGAKLFVREITG